MSQVYTFENSVFPPGSVVQSLTGDSGGPITPDPANNINIVGGTGITVAGTALNSTLTISTNGSSNLNWTNVNTTPYGVLATDEYLSVDCTGGDITLLLPDNPVLGKTFIIKDRRGFAEINTIFVTTVSGITLIDGVNSYTIPNAYSSLSVMGNGTSYEIF